MGFVLDEELVCSIPGELIRKLIPIPPSTLPALPSDLEKR